MPAPQSACEPFALAQWTGEASLLLLRRQRRPNAGPQDRQGWQGWQRLKVKLEPSWMSSRIGEIAYRILSKTAAWPLS